MKVLAITLAKKDWVTGVWTFLEITRKALEAEGIQYVIPDHWLNHREPRRPLRAIVKALSWFAGTPYEIDMRRRLTGPALAGITRRLSRFHNPDVLHIQGSLAAGLILDFLRAERVPWVLHLHSVDSELIRAEGIPPDHPLVIFSDHLLRKSIREAPVTCAVSHNLRDRIAALGIDVSRVRVVHNPIIVPELPDVPRTGPYIFLSARLTPWKGVDLAISAWERVEKELPEVFLYIAGSGPEEPSLRNLIKERDLKRVVFLGMLSWEEAMSWASKALLVLNPSVPRGGARESLPFSVLEGMALGVPVISSDTGGAKEALGDAGILIPPFDTEAMADAMIRLIKDEALRRELGQKGIRRAKEVFGPELYARRMRDAFASAIGSL
ncbi:MAG: glycosyltransferase family 4 protein [candidate division WOR-3 bacterium]